MRADEETGDIRQDDDRTGQESSRLQEQARQREVGLLREFLYFLRTNKRWWLAPIIISLLVFAALVVLSSQAAIAPWIYSFF